MSSNQLFVTGFGPFYEVRENPSEALARACGAPFGISAVSYDATRIFLDGLDPERFEKLLLLGVHGHSNRFHLEVLAHNRVCAKADVSGFTPENDRIRDEFPSIVSGSLWDTVPLHQFLTTEQASLAFDPGGYLCNFIYFEALARFPDKKVGFVHVPLESAMPLSDQHLTLKRLIGTICP
jgi:pyrrolidone-carboxylate peptidase